MERHPSVMHPRDHASHPDQHGGVNTRVAGLIGRYFGSMGMFWTLVVWQLVWMTLATVGTPLLRSDPYPFAFLLFLSNLIQLWALPALGFMSNRAAAEAAAKTEVDHQTLTSLHTRVDEIHALLGGGRPARCTTGEEASEPAPGGFPGGSP